MKKSKNKEQIIPRYISSNPITIKDRIGLALEDFANASPLEITVAGVTGGVIATIGYIGYLIYDTLNKI